MRAKIGEYAIIYTLGALGYCIIEILWRGYSHWTMTVTGGICFMLIYFVNRSFNGEMLLKKCMLCAAAVTAVEFVVGCVVNLLLGWDVWDYSDQPFSLYGQICPGFFALWFVLCIPATAVAEMIWQRVFWASPKAKGK